MSPAFPPRRSFGLRRFVGLLLVLVPWPGWGQSAGGDTVRYTLSVPDPAEKVLHVAAEFPAGGAEILASLPAWTPGSYTIENYARNVRNFSAADPSGKALEWDKADPDTWRVRTQGAARARLTFDYYADSLDLDRSKVFDDFAFYNGTNVFLFEPGRTARPATLTLELQPGWKVATGLPQAGAPNRFVAADYDRLVDAPTFLGNFQLDAFTAAGKPAQLAVYPADAFSAEQREEIRRALDRILTEQGRIVGALPFESYTVLLYVGSWQTGFAGGLEHANSHFDILDPAFAQAFELAFPVLQSLLAHETFHAWNVKRIRPAAMWPYDYERWQPTELLWFSEGVTDYYADLTLARAGLYSQEQFFGQVESNLTRLQGEPAPVSVEDASLNTWLGPNPNYGDPYVYYPKGALLGLLLDVRIRHASGNERSLDTVVRELYTNYYATGKGFTTADLLRLLEDAGGDARSVYTNYIDGRDALPLTETLKLAGIVLTRTDLMEPFLGISAGFNAAGEIEAGPIEPGSPAAEAGVQPGDVLLAVGEVAVDGDPAYGEGFRRLYTNKAGTPFTIRVRRNGENLALDAKVRTRNRVEFAAEPDPAAGQLERAILQSMTGATR